MSSALVIGGTGPSGPSIVNGLCQRGFETTVLHSGRHEIDEVAHVEHIHADPSFPDELTSSIDGRTFDVVIAMYGRIRYLPEVLAGRTTRLITVGATGYLPSLSAPATEDTGRIGGHKLFERVLESERTVLDAHQVGALEITHLRFPWLYGPRQLAPHEWCIIRRLLDGRRRLLVLDGGRTLETRAFSLNAASAVLTCVDEDASRGRVYNVADAASPSIADRITLIAEHMKCDVELVSVPPAAGVPAWYYQVGLGIDWSRGGDPPSTEHRLIDSSRIRRELGYEDAVSAEEGLRLSVDWLLEHHPEPGGEVEKQLGDPFDYAAEDAFISASDSFLEETRSIPLGGEDYRHPYAHPKN